MVVFSEVFYRQKNILVEHILIGVELFSCYRVLASIFFEVLQYEVFFVSQPALVEVGLIKQLESDLAAKRLR